MPAALRDQPHRLPVHPVLVHYLVRRTWISVLLNGRRFSLRWPWLEQEGRAYSTPLQKSSSTFQSV